MTHSRLCIVCSLAILEDNARSISAKQGAPYLRQQARTYLKARKALIDAGLLSS